MEEQPGSISSSLRVVVQPHQDSLSVAIYLTHQLDLEVLSNIVGLVDADGVDPDITRPFPLSSLKCDLSNIFGDTNPLISSKF